MRAGHLRLLLVLDAVALGAAGAALVLGVGLPLSARGALGPDRVVVVALSVAVAVALAGAVLLLRQVGRPVDRILAAAGALGASAEELPLLGAPGEGGGRGLSGAAVAFERLASALVAERARLAEKVAELEQVNAALLAARESLIRAERLATAGRLASGIAHEIGNPLGAIAGYVELARDRLEALEHGRAEGSGGREPSEAGRASPGQELDDFLARIGDESRRIDQIVRDLLDLARPAEAEHRPVQLAGPVDAALRLARVQPRFREVEVAVELAPDLPAVLADERRLAQVFLNLFLNAGDAMAGAGRVRVSAVEEDDVVLVRVADSGPGIPPEDLARVFEPFFTTKGAGHGTGLGLAISQGIVEAAGGELSAENGPGGGAVFTVRLRRAG